MRALAAYYPLHFSAHCGDPRELPRRRKARQSYGWRGCPHPATRISFLNHQWPAASSSSAIAVRISPTRSAPDLLANPGRASLRQAPRTRRGDWLITLAKLPISMIESRRMLRSISERVEVSIPISLATLVMGRSPRSRRIAGPAPVIQSSLLSTQTSSSGETSTVGTQPAGPARSVDVSWGILTHATVALHISGGACHVCGRNRTRQALRRRRSIQRTRSCRSPSSCYPAWSSYRVCSSDRSSPPG